MAHLADVKGLLGELPCGGCGGGHAGQAHCLRHRLTGKLQAGRAGCDAQANLAVQQQEARGIRLRLQTLAIERRLLLEVLCEPVAGGAALCKLGLGRDCVIHIGLAWVGRLLRRLGALGSPLAAVPAFLLRRWCRDRLQRLRGGLEALGERGERGEAPQVLGLLAPELFHHASHDQGREQQHGQQNHQERDRHGRQLRWHRPARRRRDRRGEGEGAARGDAHDSHVASPMSRAIPRPAATTALRREGRADLHWP
mmetsp:Transcript_120540/g.348360  ORF Transcript_120540/g.348360 Transcript_120540/m.348360 type:complete len:254 (+) Transcript_120540:94-855(+)